MATTNRSGLARFRFWLFITLSIMPMFYAGSYYRLSRRGMQEARTMNMRGFLYISINSATDERAMSHHYRLATLYAPANAMDRALTGAEEPVRCILFGFTK